MNKFLLASFGLAVIASGLAFGADSTKKPNLVDLEIHAMASGLSYNRIIVRDLAGKQEEIKQLKQAQAEAAQSFWTKGRIAGAVVTGLVVTGALVAAANQKGYTPTALQPYFDRVAGSSLVSSVKSVGTWVDTKTAGVRAVIGSGASYVGSNAKGAYDTVSSKASSFVRGWFQEKPVVPSVVAPVVTPVVTPVVAPSYSWMPSWATFA